MTIGQAGSMESPMQRLGSFLSLSLLISGCATAPPREDITITPSEQVERLTPRITRTEALRETVSLTWEVDRDRADILQGYHIYIGRDPGLAELPTGDPHLLAARFSELPYAGDTDGDIRRESATIENLRTGERYFLHVRTAFPDGRESPPSQEVAAIPRPRGQMVLAPRFSEGPTGFCFSEDSVVEATSDLNDLYLYEANGHLFLASPNRFDPFLRETGFLDLGSSDTLEDHPVYPAGSPTSSDRLSVTFGRSIGVRLSDGRVAKLRPLRVDTAHASTRLILEYVFQPIRGERQF